MTQVPACSALQMYNQMTYFPPPSPPFPGNYSGNFSGSPPPGSPPPSPMPCNGSCNGTGSGQYYPYYGYYPGYTAPQMEPVCDPERIPEVSAQGKVLLAWRDSMQASDNPGLTSWGMGDPCTFSWAGVTCENGTVVAFSLAQQSTTNNNMGPGYVNMQYTYIHGDVNWQILTNLTSLKAVGLQVSCVACSNNLLMLMLPCAQQTVSGQVNSLRVQQSVSPRVCKPLDWLHA